MTSVGFMSKESDYTMTTRKGLDKPCYTRPPLTDAVLHREKGQQTDNVNIILMRCLDRPW